MTSAYNQEKRVVKVFESCLQASGFAPNEMRYVECYSIVMPSRSDFQRYPSSAYIPLMKEEDEQFCNPQSLGHYHAERARRFHALRMVRSMTLEIDSSVMKVVQVKSSMRKMMKKWKSK